MYPDNLTILTIWLTQAGVILLQGRSNRKGGLAGARKTLQDAVFGGAAVIGDEPLAFASVPNQGQVRLLVGAAKVIYPQAHHSPYIPLHLRQIIESQRLVRIELGPEGADFGHYIIGQPLRHYVVPALNLHTLLWRVDHLQPHPSEVSGMRVLQAEDDTQAGLVACLPLDPLLYQHFATLEVALDYLIEPKTYLVVEWPLPLA